MAEESRPATSFNVPGAGASYQFKRMPMGLTISSAVMQRHMSKVMQGYEFEFVITYVDDTVVFSKS